MWDDHAIKSLSQNIQCGIKCMAVYLKLHIAGVQIIKFKRKKAGNQRPIVLTIGTENLATIVLQKIFVFSF